MSPDEGGAKFGRGGGVTSNRDRSLTISGVRIASLSSLFSFAIFLARSFQDRARNAGGPRLAPRNATSPHIGISRSRATFLNNELRSSEHDPRNERERARIQQEMEDESGHGTLPITTQSPRSSAAGLTPLLKFSVSRRDKRVTPHARQKGLRASASTSVRVQRMSRRSLSLSVISSLRVRTRRRHSRTWSRNAFVISIARCR